MSPETAMVGGSPTDAAFVRELHRTLAHLYDPSELRRARLIDLLGIGQSADPASSLQRLLLQAIEALKPGSSVPSHANAWRIYHILNQRYAGQFRSDDIATNLAISGRQLRRLQILSLQTLGDYLWTHYGFKQKPAARDAHPTATTEPRQPVEPDAPSRDQELAWLGNSAPGDPVGVGDVIQAALAVAGPLIDTSRVGIESQVPEDLPLLAGHATAIRHALLSLLTAAIGSAEGGTIKIQAQAQAGQIWIDVHSLDEGGSGSTGSAARQTENVEMARQLVGLCGGSLELAFGPSSPKPCHARLILPAVERVKVLVVEDNADTLLLLERYLTGSRFRFVGVSDPRLALDLAVDVRAQIVVLDLMLPGMDGWELLGRLREHPRTRGVPVVVCTILPHEDLALALGAAALVRKPVSREAFLSALDRQLVPSVQVSD